MITLKPMILAAIAATLAFAPGTGSAETRSVAVSYADINLASPAGIARLDRRIETAVTSICGADRHNDASWAEIRKCRQGALASAREQRTLALAAAELHRNGVEMASK